MQRQTEMVSAMPWTVTYELYVNYDLQTLNMNCDLWTIHVN